MVSMVDKEIITKIADELAEYERISGRLKSAQRMRKVAEYAIIEAREDERKKVAKEIIKTYHIKYTIRLVNAEERGKKDGAVEFYQSIKSKFTKAGLTEKEMNESDFRRGQNSILENMESELRRKGWII